MPAPDRARLEVTSATRRFGPCAGLKPSSCRGGFFAAVAGVLFSASAGAQARPAPDLRGRPDAPHHCLESASAPQVTLTWPGVRPAGATATPRGALTLRLENHSERLVTVELTRTLLLDGALETTPLGDVDLTARGHHELRVALPVRGRGRQPRGASGELRVEAVVREAPTGRLLESPSTPSVFLHETGRGVVASYGHAHLTRRDADHRRRHGGHPQGLIRRQAVRAGLVADITPAEGLPLRPPARPTPSDGAPPSLTELFVPPPQPSDVVVCAALPFSADDRLSGDLATETTLPASGMYYTLRPSLQPFPNPGGPGPVVATGRFSEGQTACISIPAALAADGVYLTTYLDSEVGALQKNRILHFVDVDDSDITWPSTPEAIPVPRVQSYLPPASAGPINLVLPYSDALAFGHGAVVFGVQRVEALLSVPGPLRRIAVVTDSDAYASISNGVIRLGPRVRRKYLVGHEIGHLFFWRYGGQYGLIQGGAFGDDHCPSIDGFSPLPINDHWLMGLEGAALAHVEGFAHFIAATIMTKDGNATGTFQYYKGPSKSDGHANFETINLNPDPAYPVAPGEPQVNLLHNVCGCVGATGSVPTPVNALECDRVGTELDWLRFWWAFRHSAMSAEPTLLEILDDISGQAVPQNVDPDYDAGPNIPGRQYESLLQSVNDHAPAYTSRFMALGCPFGVGGCP